MPAQAPASSRPTISDVRAYLLVHPLRKPLEFSFGVKRERVTGLIEVRTRDGLTGWGEANWGGTAAGGKALLSLISERVRPALRGRDPFHAETVWSEMDQLRYDANRVSAAGAVDVALHDLMGQTLGRPIHDLLGGARREEIPMYASDLMIVPIPELTRRAKELVARGFRGVKMRVGRAAEEDPARVAAVRDAVGEGVKLFVDANCHYSRAQALRVGRALEALSIAHFEEPLPKWDIEGYAELARALAIPLAAGECTHVHNIKELLARGAAQVVQPDCTINGFTETRKILALAEAFNAEAVFHNFEAGVGLAATLHAAAAAPLSLAGQLQELDCNPNPFQTELLEEPLELRRGGALAVPAKPGLGVSVKRSALEKYLAASA